MTKLFESVATLVGTIIGAGVLGIPYAISKVGVFYGSIYIIFLTLIMVLLNLYLGEITLRSKGKHQLTGYAEKYLGRTGKWLMTLAMVFGQYGALVAYLIGVGKILNGLFGLNYYLCVLAYFVIMSYFILKGLNLIKEWELLLSGLMLLILFVIIIFSLPHIDPANLKTPADLDFIVPYGVIMFAMIGMVAVPNMKQILIKEKKKLKLAIIVGTLIPAAFYLIFSVVVYLVTGSHTTEIATLGLGDAVGKIVLLLGNLFALFSMTTSFLVLGLALNWMYHYDFKIKKTYSAVLTLVVPLIIALAGVTTFIKVLGITGSLSGGLQGMLIVFMFHKVKKMGERRPEFKIRLSYTLSFLICLTFLAGIIVTLLF